MHVRPANCYLAALSTLFSSIGITYGCGRPNDDASIANLQSIPSNLDALERSDADVSTIQDVGLKDRDGFSSTVSPSYLPKAGASAENLTLVFYPKFTVPAGSKFVYDKTKWMVVVGKNTQYVTSADLVEEIKEDGNFASGEVREGTVTIRFRLTTQAQWPSKLTDDAAFDTIDGRKALKIQPYYSLEGAVPPGNAGTLQGLSAAYMKDDIGSIVAPAEARSVAVNDGAFSFAYNPPADTTAIDTASGTPTSVGKSNVSGYVVVYWKDSACAQGGWSFKPNKVFDKKKSNSDLSCAYSGIDNAIAGSSTCALGCSVDVNDDFFGKSAESIAMPPEIPTKAGEENAIDSGCLRIVRIDGVTRTSFAVNNALNGERYGVMVYPLDSAGNIGLTRSRCLEAKPFNVAFASSKKSPGLGKSKSDCFVVTAASGSVDSPAVHYWRVIRDSWLDRLGVSAFYYRHGPHWAAWLDQHPSLKAPTNFVLENTGRAMVKFSQWLNKLHSKLQELKSSTLSVLGDVFVSAAYADDTSPAAVKTEAPSSSSADPDFYIPFRGEPSPRGSAATTLMMAAGQTTPSEDKEFYDLSFKGKKPTFLLIAQSFRLFDFWGELGLGYELGGVMMKGKSADTNKVTTSLFGYGGGILAEYRLRIGERPWISPRFSYVYGKMRMREEAAAVASESSSSGGSTTGASSTLDATGTTPVWHNYSTLRAGLDFSVSRLHGDDQDLIRYGYEVEDLVLSVFAAQHTNRGKAISTSGLQLGGGFSFLFR